MNERKAIGIVAKPDIQNTLPVLKRAIDFLISNKGKTESIEWDGSVILDPSAHELLGHPEFLSLTRDEMPSRCYVIIVLGGDGTLLSMARRIGTRGIPLIGINVGTLGFITDFHKNEIDKALSLVVTGKMEYEKRMIMKATLTHNDSSKKTFNCLNDIVITKSALARIIEMRIMVNGGLVTDMRADGLIISTPTGSTAYNLSAGGAIICPTIEALILTPLCPHTLTMRPIIIPSTSKIEIQLISDARQVYLTADGQEGIDFKKEDNLVIVKEKKGIFLAISPERSYFDLLREKLLWGENKINGE